MCVCVCVWVCVCVCKKKLKLPAIFTMSHAIDLHKLKYDLQILIGLYFEYATVP